MKPFNFTKTSDLTGVEHTRTIEMTDAQYARVMSPNRTELIQTILPHHSADDREFLISGSTPKEWEIFMDEEQ